MKTSISAAVRLLLVLVVLSAGVLRPMTFAQAQDRGHVIPEGTVIQLSLRDPVSSKLSEPGDEVHATVRADVVADGYTLLRQGTEVIGRVTIAEPAKAPLKGGRLHITFDRIRIDGQERKITTVIKSTSDFTRDEKVKTDGEGTLKGGKDGGKVLSNVLTAGGLGMIGLESQQIIGSLRGGAGGAHYGAVILAPFGRGVMPTCSWSDARCLRCAIAHASFVACDRRESLCYSRPRHARANHFMVSIW